MLDKSFDPKSVEAKHYSNWEKSGYFTAPVDASKEPYCIMMPPPNVTGSLHMGHALTFTLQDVLTRYHRMSGKDTLWQPGTDHAGIATQSLVERMLDKEGSSRHTLGRDKFLERVWAWKGESGGMITDALRGLGASADWSRERFTLDEGLSAAVRKVFVDLHAQGLIYRAKRLVNWDTQLKTAISDLEVEQREVNGQLYYIKYPIENSDEFITVATTRPETMFGDSGVAVNPTDERYQHLIGKHVVLPFVNRKIPIVADEHSDPDKGTGAVKITPAHDFNDFEVGVRHKLEQINILNDDGTLNDQVPAEFQGLATAVARKKAVEAMEALGLVDKIEPHKNMVPYGDRSGTVIEPYLTDQWYVDAATLAKPALEAVQTGKTKFVPEQWTKTYYNWMENIQPWCISRQLWWGHRIPAWYGDDGKIYVALSEEEAQKQAGSGVKLKQDEDVLDTWFSSALWPFSTLGWPDKTAELERYYPTDVLVTGFDIIFFWVARMMMMGCHFMKDVPFETVYVHALVRDEKGQKMSKSKGNVIDPRVLIDKFGADALRFALASLSVPGQDIKIGESHVEKARNFVTKIWNASRYAEMNGVRLNGELPKQVNNKFNVWILSGYSVLHSLLVDLYKDYRFDQISWGLYHSIWNEFCDWYVEFTKSILKNPEHPDHNETKAVMGWVWREFLVLLHPLMPYVTEEIYKELGSQSSSIMSRKPYDGHLPLDLTVITDVQKFQDIISEIRTFRSALGLAPNVKIGATFSAMDLVIDAQVLMDMTGINLGTIAGQSAKTSVHGVTITLEVSEVDKAKAYLEKERANLVKEIERLNKKLGNPALPEAIRAEDTERLQTTQSDFERRGQILQDLAA